VEAAFTVVAFTEASLPGDAYRPFNQLDGGPGPRPFSGIQIIRSNTSGGFSVRVTLYGKADKKIVDRAIICFQREKRRHFHLND
jgi:hypothetical protein